MYKRRWWTEGKRGEREPSQHERKRHEYKEESETGSGMNDRPDGEPHPCRMSDDGAKGPGQEAEEKVFETPYPSGVWTTTCWPSAHFFTLIILAAVSGEGEGGGSKHFLLARGLPLVPY